MACHGRLQPGAGAPSMDLYKEMAGSWPAMQGAFNQNSIGLPFVGPVENGRAPHLKMRPTYASRSELDRHAHGGNAWEHRVERPEHLTGARAHERRNLALVLAAKNVRDLAEERQAAPAPA